MKSPQFPRVFAPVVTPFTSDLAVDTERFMVHCEELIRAGAGLALFGTTSEANSLALDERRRILEVVLASGIPKGMVMPGTGTCSIPETVTLTNEAVRAGCPGVLVLPTFFYKNQTTAGIVAYYREVIERVADERLRVFLYNIPGLSGVSISVDVLSQLADHYPEVIVGLKDSSGHWPTTLALLDLAAPQGLSVYVGSERYLLATLAAGGRGCISATVNVNAPQIVDLAEQPDCLDARTKQRHLTAMRSALEESGPLIPVVKAQLAVRYGHDGWRRVRPPFNR